jgi:hypothetical protein
LQQPVAALLIFVAADGNITSPIFFDKLPVLQGGQS